MPKQEQTQEQARDEIFLEWTATIEKLWQAIGKPVDQSRLEVYVEELRFIPLGLLDKAVSRALRTGGSYQTVPTLGAIWDAIREELQCKRGQEPESIEMWVYGSLKVYTFDGAQT